MAAAPVTARVVALTGDLAGAASGSEIRHRLEAFTVIEQRGDGFGNRLATTRTPDSAAALGGIRCCKSAWTPRK